MKTWKNAEVVELNISETAWGRDHNTEEKSYITGDGQSSHDCNAGDPIFGWLMDCSDTQNTMS